MFDHGTFQRYVLAVTKSRTGTWRLGLGDVRLGTRDSGLGTPDSGLGTPDSGLGDVINNQHLIFALNL